MNRKSRLPPFANRESSPEVWTIGADPQCDVVVNLPTVSSRHCRLMRTRGGYVLEDLQSTNGTFVNGVRITSPTRVTPDDRITLGRNIVLPWPKSAVEAIRQTAEPTNSKSDDAERYRGGIITGKEIRIGRLPDNDIVIDYPVVSGHHARVVFEQGQAWIEDCGSQNGTAIGSPQNRITRARLSPGDIVYFGSMRVPASRLLAGGLALGQKPFQSVEIVAAETVIGRAPSCSLVLDDPRVSRQHARLTRLGEQWLIEDLGSSAGTYVNGRRITNPQPLRPGDLVAIGRFTLKFTAQGNLEQRDYRGNVSIQARQVCVDVPNRRLVENVSLTVYPSELVALMGPSGAGKTTLMNALNGYSIPSAGEVLFNGRNLYSHYGEFQGVIGYVPQDDIMHRELTVREALYFTARLRLADDISDAEILQRVSEVSAKLGLQAALDVPIGSPEKKGISGGQRKRVNLAMELLTDPAVLFLDEPTSGLSSEDTLMIMRLLRKLADDGKTIIITIHQPSLEAYRLLDNLIVVSTDPGSGRAGRLVYYGPAYPQAVEFFNPDGIEGLKPGQDPSPDEVLRGLARKKTDEWVARYESSAIKQQFVDDREGAEPVVDRQQLHRRAKQSGNLHQWYTLVRRCVAIKLRDVTNTVILLAQAPIIALLVVGVLGSEAAKKMDAGNWSSVAQATTQTIFLLALAALWFGCSNSAREIVGEWAIYRRERMVNLSISSYIGSKFTVLGVLCLVQCTVLLVIVGWGAGLKAPLIPMFLLLLLVALVGVAVGLLISSVAKTSEVAIALLPLVLLPMVIMAGILQPIHKMSPTTRAIAHIMPSRWAFEGLLLLESAERPESAFGDMAENYFPKGEHRAGSPASAAVLTMMLVLLVAAIYRILRARDIIVFAKTTNMEKYRFSPME